MAPQEPRAALVTGGANGIGAAVAERLIGRGWSVVLADIDEPSGTGVAAALGAHFVLCDVTDLEQNRAAVAAVLDRFGRCDLASLNAGIGTGSDPDLPFDKGFDIERYRRAMGVNLDGVVLGAVAALPALRESGGDLIATASLAGLTAAPFDPVYGANKHAVVGLVRSLAPGLQAQGVRFNALCPGFADTAILGGLRPQLEAAGIPLLSAEAVADAVEAILAARTTGQCWFVQPGRESEPFAFRNVPGPR